MAREWCRRETMRLGRPGFGETKSKSLFGENNGRAGASLRMKSLGLGPQMPLQEIERVVNWEASGRERKVTRPKHSH